MKEALKQTLLDSSYETLASKGVSAIRMRDLAKSCQCSVGTIYNAFDTFAQLHFHLNLRTFKILFNRLFAALKKAESEGIPLKEILPILGWDYIAFAKTQTHSWKSLFEEAPKVEQPLWYRNEIDKHLQEIEMFLEKAFSISREKANRLINYFWFAIHGVCSIVLNKKATNHSEEFIEPYVDHCLRGIYQLM